MPERVPVNYNRKLQAFPSPLIHAHLRSLVPSPGARGIPRRRPPTASLEVHQVPRASCAHEDEKQAWLGHLRVVQGKPLTALSPTPPTAPTLARH